MQQWPGQVEMVECGQFDLCHDELGLNGRRNGRVVDDLHLCRQNGGQLVLGLYRRRQRKVKRR